MSELICALSGFMFAMGVYILLRLRSLKIKFKSSDKAKFLDFFEEDYLNKSKRTWRRKWSFVYNSKIYSILNVWYAVTVLVFGILLLVGLFIAKHYLK